MSCRGFSSIGRFNLNVILTLTPTPIAPTGDCYFENCYDQQKLLLVNLNGMFWATKLIFDIILSVIPAFVALRTTTQKLLISKTTVSKVGFFEPLNSFLVLSITSAPVAPQAL